MPEPAVTISFVGHRNNRLPPAALPALGCTLERLFADIDAAVERPVVLATGMAEGADLMAARLRPSNWHLHAVLCETPQSLAGRMTDAADATTLIDLLAAADATTTILDGAADDYAGQASMLLDAATLLVAVWDGDPAILPGGTADTLARAIGRAIPAFWLSPQGDRAMIIEGALDAPLVQAATPAAVAACIAAGLVARKRVASN